MRIKYHWYVYLPENAEDNNSCNQRDERNSVTNGIANLHLPEKLSLKMIGIKKGGYIVYENKFIYIQF